MTKCACGRELHYPSEALQEEMERVIELAGDEYVKIVLHRRAGNRAFMVQRHFAALHGIKAPELPEIAKKFGFEEVEV